MTTRWGHVLVTGAGRGIGRATAERLARDGARLSLLARTREGLEATEAACRALGAEVLTLTCDVASGPAVEAAIERARAAFGPLETVINNAGVGRYAPFLELTEADWESMLAVNVKGVANVMRAALPDMVAARSGFILNVSSMQGLQTGPRASAYSATKYAVMALSEAVGREMVEHGVRVGVICPGGVLTGFAGVPAEQKNERFMTPEEIADVIVDMLSAPARVWMKQVVAVPFM